jgi:hypothetical protein
MFKLVRFFSGNQGFDVHLAMPFVAFYLVQAAIQQSH